MLLLTPGPMFMYGRSVSDVFRGLRGGLFINNGVPKEG